MSLHRPDEWATRTPRDLLAHRLASLEESGIVWREPVPPPVAATLYHLTDTGADLEPVLYVPGYGVLDSCLKKAKQINFRSHWFKRPVSMFEKTAAPDGPPVSIQLSPEDYPAVIEASPDGIRTRPGRVERPDLELAGPPHLILGIISGRLSVKERRRPLV